MKKILNRLIKGRSKAPETGGRITNETVAEHRERVLAGGRKFKYPLQYTKHRVLFITVIIGILSFVLFIVFFCWQLYFAQAYDKFTYGLTRVLPVPVAQVDADAVRYSDYLSELRSAVHYLTSKEAVNFNSADGKRQLDYQKRLALDKAIRDTYIARLASQNNVNVTSKEVDDFVNRQIASNKLGVSQEVYKQVISDYYDWTFDEYKNSVRQEMLSKKVNASLDKEARQKAVFVWEQIARGIPFDSVAKDLSEDNLTKGNGGDVGFVSKSSEDPNGLIAVASALQPGQVSSVIEGADGFYVVKLLEKRDTGDVRFAKVFVAYKVVAQKIADLKKQGKVNEYITVTEIANPISQ